MSEDLGCLFRDSSNKTGCLDLGAERLTFVIGLPLFVILVLIVVTLSITVCCMVSKIRSKTKKKDKLCIADGYNTNRRDADGFELKETSLGINEQDEAVKNISYGGFKATDCTRHHEDQNHGQMEKEHRSAADKPLPPLPQPAGKPASTLPAKSTTIFDDTVYSRVMGGGGGKATGGYREEVTLTPKPTSPQITAPKKGIYDQSLSLDYSGLF